MSKSKSDLRFNPSNADSDFTCISVGPLNRAPVNYFPIAES